MFFFNNTSSNKFAEGGNVKTRITTFVLTVPNGKDYLLTDEQNHYDLESVMSKALTKKWFGHGTFDVRHKNNLSNRTAIFTLTVPAGKEYMISDEENHYEIESLISSALRKKWFGHGAFTVLIIDEDDINYNYMYYSKAIIEKLKSYFGSHVVSVEKTTPADGKKRFKVYVTEETTLNEIEKIVDEINEHETINDVSMPKPFVVDGFERDANGSYVLILINIEKFAKGGDVKKLTRAEKQYNKDVDLYKWFVVDIANKKAVSGWEFKSDAMDALADYNKDKNFTVVSEKLLDKMGVPNPKQEWKYADGGIVPHVLKGLTPAEVKELYYSKQLTQYEAEQAIKLGLLKFDKKEDGGEVNDSMSNFVANHLSSGYISSRLHEYGFTDGTYKDVDYVRVIMLNQLQQKDQEYSIEALNNLIKKSANYLKAEQSHRHIYMMLSRLQMDCEYYLGFGNRVEKYLWGLNVPDHIAEMKKLWNSLPADAKPEWLTMEQIETYEKDMLNPQGEVRNGEVAVDDEYLNTDTKKHFFVTNVDADGWVTINSEKGSKSIQTQDILSAADFKRYVNMGLFSKIN